MRKLIITVLCFSYVLSYGQQNGFPFGQATYKELAITRYELDTTASALVLDEFGEAHIDDEFNLLFSYHARIKILKTEGLEYATFEIPLRKADSRYEAIVSVKASAFNVENGSMRESKLEAKNIFLTDVNKYVNVKKFAIPNAKVGSVIEVLYTLQSPFVYNFRSWEFQGDIPKIKSEYWCRIPGIYHYNISLKGFLKLTKNESDLVRGCFVTGGQSADCARLKFGMENIPAFKEEEYMTAKANFMATVNFELSQINYFDGRKDKITKEWKDADEELRQNPEFGVQIRKGKDALDRPIDEVISGETDHLRKAQKIYDFIKTWYTWNEVYGKYSDAGIKKAFEARTGNVGDINLSLIAALKYAGLTVEPVLLSTRDNGLATELYPVLSEFNYVIAKVTIGDKIYLLDATDDFHPFGLIPERCLNGKGRVLGEKDSYWHEMKPAEKGRSTAILNLTLSTEGMKGFIQCTRTGYAAVNERKKIAEFTNQQDYINAIKTDNEGVSIKDFKLENADRPDKPLVLTINVEVDAADLLLGDKFFFNPFLIEQWKTNPFRSTERLYPVDFGAPLEDVLILNLTYPSNFEVEEIPAKVALALPKNGGHYIFEIQNSLNKLTMNSTLLIGKPIFSSHEYHYLKELFNNVVATQQTQLVFKEKK